MKKVVFKYEEELMFGGSKRHNLKFIIGDQIKEDVDILLSDGRIHHGFRFDNIKQTELPLSKITDLGEVIILFENLVKELKEI